MRFEGGEPIGVAATIGTDVAEGLGDHEVRGGVGSVRIRFRGPVGELIGEAVVFALFDEVQLFGCVGIRAIFGDDLPADPRFAKPVTDALARLFRDGASRTAADVARGAA